MGAPARCCFQPNCNYSSSLNANAEVFQGVISLSVNDTDNAPDKFFVFCQRKWSAPISWGLLSEAPAWIPLADPWLASLMIWACCYHAWKIKERRLPSFPVVAIPVPGSHSHQGEQAQSASLLQRTVKCEAGHLPHRCIALCGL